MRTDTRTDTHKATRSNVRTSSCVAFLFGAIFSGGEFRGGFKTTLSNKFKIRVIHTSTGFFPKCSPIERAVRSYKSIMFSVCFHYGTLKIDNILQLTNHIYNRRRHQGIGLLTPLSAHFCTHAASIVSQLNDANHLQHKLDAAAVYSRTKPREILQIGDRVKVRLERSIFRKHQPLSRSLWSESTSEITAIDTNDFPPLYSLENHTKKFYGFELLKVSKYFPIVEARKNREAKILVNDYKLSKKTFLRSGREKLDESEPIYSILKDGHISFINRDELKSYKKIFGSQALLYSSHFNHPPHNAYIE